MFPRWSGLRSTPIGSRAACTPRSQGSGTRRRRVWTSPWDASAAHEESTLMDSMVLVVAVGAIVAGFVQGLSGFAFGLTAMSFWAWYLEPKMAAVLAVFGALTGQIIGALSVRRGFNMRRLWPFLAGGLVGIPAGVAILAALDVQLFKAVLGTLLVVWCPLMLMARNLPRIQAGGPLADGIVGGLGGIMGGHRRLHRDDSHAVVHLARVREG